MKYLFTLSLLVAVHISFSQLLKVDFEVESLSNIDEVKTLGSVGLVEDLCKGEKSLIMIENSSIIIEKESNYGIGTLKFRYSALNISNGAGFDLKISFFSEIDEEYRELSKISQNSNRSVCYDKELRILTDTDVKRVKIEIVNYNTGELVLDDLELIELSPDNYGVIQKNQNEASTVELTNGILESIQNEKFTAFKKNVKNLQKEYFNNVKSIVNLNNFITHMQITTKSYEIFNERNKMVNPLNYSEFDDFISEITTYSDSVQISYINDLKRTFETQKKQYDISQKAKSKFGKVLSFASNVGNILSGGKLSSVVNSFKGIMSSTFTKANLESKYPAFKAVTAELKVNGDKVNSQVYIRDQDNIEKVKKVLQNSKKRYEDFSGFFGVIEKEYELLDIQANSWKEANKRMQLVSEKCKNFLVEYVSLVDPEFKKNTEGQYRLLGNQSEEMARFGSNVNAFFKTMQNKDTFTNYEEAIKESEGNMAKVSELIDDYRSIVGLFRSLYVDMKNSLEGSQNPWTEYMVKENRLESFKKAEKNWNDQRSLLLSANMLPSVIKLIEDSYVNVDIRNHVFVPESL